MIRSICSFGVLFLSFLLVSVQPATATVVSGQVLTSDTTWVASGNPYHITGDIEVAPGVTLTIGPGVNVVIASTDDTLSGNNPDMVEFKVHGSLVISGTAASRVTMSADGSGEPDPILFGWLSIYIYLGGSANVNYASIGGVVDGITTHAPGSAVSISNTQFYDFSTGVVVHDGSPTIDATLFSGASDGGSSIGIRVEGSGAPIITNVIGGRTVLRLQWG